jgi:hypothetical protein
VTNNYAHDIWSKATSLRMLVMLTLSHGGGGGQSGYFEQRSFYSIKKNTYTLKFCTYLLHKCTVT